jgi:hypothetical protein
LISKEGNSLYNETKSDFKTWSRMKEKDNGNTQIIIYKTEDGQVKIDVRFDGETVWLTQNALADLFQTTKQNVSLHIKKIYKEDELKKDSTVKYYLTVQNEGTREISRELEYYNLDLIISVGYRIKSNIATAFRQWATNGQNSQLSTIWLNNI